MLISPANRPARRSSRRRPLQRDRAGGFTLMEVVLAMAVIGLLVGLGLPAIRHQTGVVDLRIKAFEIASLLRVDRNAALRSGRRLSVTVDPGTNSVRSEWSSASIRVSSSVAMRLTPAGASGFQFLPDGRAAGGTLSLTSSGRTILIEVNAVTAAIDTRTATR